jgi:hypothetical protein
MLPWSDSHFTKVLLDGNRYSIETNKTGLLWKDALQSVRGSTKSRPPTADLDDPLQGLIEYSRSQRTRILLLIDNLDIFLKSAVIADLRKIREITDSSVKQHVVMVAACSEHPDQIVDENLQLELNESPFHNFQVIYLRPLSPAETMAYVARRGMRDEEADFLYELSGGYPRLVNIVAEELVLLGRALGRRPNAAELETLRKSLVIDDRVVWLCHTLYHELLPSQQRILVSVLEGFHDHEAPAYESVVNKLVNHHGLLVRRKGGLSIFSWLFAEVVKNQLVGALPTDREPPVQAGATSRQNVLQQVPRTLTNVSPTFSYHEDSGVMEIQGKVVILSNLENRLFAYLLANRNRTCSNEELLTFVWTGERSPKVVERGINRLREKVERDPKNPENIVNIKGKGYRLML